MIKVILLCLLVMFLHIDFTYAGFPEYGSRECSRCYDEQDSCYRQDNHGCTDDAIPCIQNACTHSKINR